MVRMFVVLFLAVAVCFGVPALAIDRINRYEGDVCPLKSGKNGVCRKSRECPDAKKVIARERHCEFSSQEPVICCPVPANVTPQPTLRVVEDKCNTDVKAYQGPKLADHVVGNSVVAGVGEYPFTGLVIFDEDREIRCGAALISKKFVLSAVHCFKRNKPKAVILGTNLATDPDPDRYDIANVFNHAGYNQKTKHDDIALLQLKTEVRTNSNVEPICLHTSQIDLDPNMKLDVIGWGIKSTVTLRSSDSLLRGTVKPMLRSKCQTIYSSDGYNLQITDKQICAVGEKSAGGDYTDACSGDSGGPLVLQQNNKYYLVGVVSAGSGCGSGIPGIYTRVASYLDWITERVWQT